MADINTSRRYDKNLYKLSELKDFEVAKGDPDVRGWDVLSADGVRFGKINDLVVDPNHMKVRYLDVDVDEDFEGVKQDRHLLIPIGAAIIHEKDDNVIINTIQTRTLLQAPPYEGMEITREYEDRVRRVYWPDRPELNKSDDRLSSKENTDAHPHDTGERPVAGIGLTDRDPDRNPDAGSHDDPRPGLDSRTSADPRYRDNYYDNDDYDETRFYGNRRGKRM